MFFNREADENLTEIGVADLDNDPEFISRPYNQMNITIFQSLRFMRGGKGQAKYHNDHGIGELFIDDPEILEKIKPYVKIAYKYTTFDLSVLPDYNYKEIYFPARKCRLTDFPSARSEGSDVYKHWEPYSLICPDFDNSGLEDSTSKLTGNIASFNVSRGEFVVERCVNGTKEAYCESNENIDNFMSDL